MRAGCAVVARLNLFPRNLGWSRVVDIGGGRGGAIPAFQGGLGQFQQVSWLRGKANSVKRGGNSCVKGSVRTCSGWFGGRSVSGGYVIVATCFGHLAHKFIYLFILVKFRLRRVGNSGASRDLPDDNL
jgi:hypothetical protein